MNTRIKELRQALGLSGEKFGEKIGLTRYAISNIENNKSSITEQTILLICHIYNVNEQWLRTGEGQMFEPTSDDFYSDMQKRYNLSDTGINLVKSYLNLSDENKLVIDKLIAEANQNTNDKEV